MRILRLLTFTALAVVLLLFSGCTPGGTSREFAALENSIIRYNYMLELELEFLEARRLAHQIAFHSENATRRAGYEARFTISRQELSNLIEQVHSSVEDDPLLSPTGRQILHDDLQQLEAAFAEFFAAATRNERVEATVLAHMQMDSLKEYLWAATDMIIFEMMNIRLRRLRRADDIAVFEHRLGMHRTVRYIKLDFADMRRTLSSVTTAENAASIDMTETHFLQASYVGIANLIEELWFYINMDCCLTATEREQANQQIEAIRYALLQYQSHFEEIFVAARANDTAAIAQMFVLEESLVAAVRTELDRLLNFTAERLNYMRI